MDPKIRAAIAAIGETPGPPSRYPRAIWDEDQLSGWVSDAEVAEVPYTAFASKKGQAVTARLIVRRVRDLNRKAAAGPGRAVPRLALPRRLHRLPVRDHPGRGAAPRPRHRGAGLRRPDQRPAGSPAIGAFPGQRRVAGPAPPSPQPDPRRRLPGRRLFAKARGATIRRDLIAVAARIARHGRGHLTLHLPEGWHRETRMDEPVRSRLRPARRRGLTSPDPVTAPARPPTAASPGPQTEYPDKPQNRPAAGKPRPETSKIIYPPAGTAR